MKKLTILIMGTSLCLFFAFTPNAQAQNYYGVFSTKVKTTYEDYDTRGNLKFFKETKPLSGELYLNSGGLDCVLDIYLDDDSEICIRPPALIITSQMKTKTKNYKEQFQMVGDGYRYYYAEDLDELGIINATGTFIQDWNGNVLTITISGTLSGGGSIHWDLGANPDNNYIWTAKFESTLTPIE